MRIVARDRYVNGLNGEFLCIKGRFGHPFVNHEDRIRTPLIRYKKGGRLIPATWDDAIKHLAGKLDAIADQYGRNAIGVVGSPRLTNESLYLLNKFATELIGTENYAVADAFSLNSFFRNLAAPLATHRDIRYARTILLLGGEPEELQPLTGKQIRQAVRNGGAKLIVANSTRIRLLEQAAQFLHIRSGSENALVLALADPDSDATALDKLGIEAAELDQLRRTITETQGDVIIMFGGELSEAAQSILAQLPNDLGGEGRRILFHPLPLFNNSIGAIDMGLSHRSVTDMLRDAGNGLRAMYVAGSFLPEHLQGREEALSSLDFLVVQELFETETTRFADVVLPAASFAEVDGTFTNNDGFVQRVRQSIPPVHQAKADWIIVDQVARELGLDFGFGLSASAVFSEIASRVPAYSELRYPLLKDEAHPVQVKHELVRQTDLREEFRALQMAVGEMDSSALKNFETPQVGHELFKLRTLTGKVPQFGLLASGNPRPENVNVSPLYQITVNGS